MPKFEALYYPYFEPPEKWLRKYLLVFDAIKTIVPENVDYRFPKGVMDIIELLPDAYGTISPTDRDKEYAYSDINFTRLDRAFKIIDQNSGNTPEELKIIIDKKDGSIEVADHVFLHNDKITDQIESLLSKHHLIKKDVADLVSGPENFSVVNRQAGDIIISELANKMGSNRGLYTVTDNQIDFTLNSLNSLQDNRTTDTKGLLISSMLRYEIPSGIEYLPLKKYKEIRDAFADLRTPFHSVIGNLSNLYRLEQITDESILKERIKEITKEFDREIKKFKKSTLIRSITSWKNVILQSLASLVGLLTDDMSSKLLLETSKIAVKSIEKIEFKRDSDAIKIQRFFAGVQKVIEDEDIKKLL